MEFSHTPVGGDTFSPPILCGHREDFKVLTFSDVFGDLRRIVSRSPPHLFISTKSRLNITFTDLCDHDD